MEPFQFSQMELKSPSCTIEEKIMSPLMLKTKWFVCLLETHTMTIHL